MYVYIQHIYISRINVPLASASLSTPKGLPANAPLLRHKCKIKNETNEKFVKNKICEEMRNN